MQPECFLKIGYSRGVAGPFLARSKLVLTILTHWERAYFLALLYVMFFLCFVTLPWGVLGQV